MAKGKTTNKRNEKGRKKTSERGYGADWQKVRERVLNDADYLCQCEKCKELGRVKVAKVVHHIKPVEDYPHLRLVESNLLAVNWFCHERIEGRIKG